MLRIIFDGSDNSSDIYRKINNKENSRLTLSKLPEEMKDKIMTEYKRIMPPKLLDWIDPKDLKFVKLLANPSEGMIPLIDSEI